MWVTNAEGTEVLLKLFNVIRSKRECSKEWKTALIQPVYKGKGSQRELENYRGISLLPVMGKIYSGMIAYRLRDWLMRHKKLTVFQTGFTNGRRKVDNIFMIKASVDKYLQAKRGRL